MMHGAILHCKCYKKIWLQKTTLKCFSAVRHGILSISWGVRLILAGPPEAEQRLQRKLNECPRAFT